MWELEAGEVRLYRFDEERTGACRSTIEMWPQASYGLGEGGIMLSVSGRSS